MNRRDAIKTIGGLAGAATLGKLLPGCDDGSDPVGITTMVFLMMENRSYDHIFGARKLQGLPGDGLPAGATNPDLADNPIAVWEASNSIADMCIRHDPPHGWGTGRAQLNGGANDGFLRTHQSDPSHGPSSIAPMQYLTRTQQPISWALADSYTSCDRWFCSALGSTMPNRAFWHCGSSFGIGPDGGSNEETLLKFASLPAPSIYNRLRDKNVEWTYYWGSLAVVGLFGGSGEHALPTEYKDARIKKFSTFGDDPGDENGTFFKDAAAGTLPPVVYIDPFFYLNDDHPPAHPIYGQALIAAVYTALAKSPQWKNCLLVITYDEWGGFYDHVPPPQVVDDTLAKYGVDGFTQLGFRVPAMVVGPYVKQGHVSSVQYDHTSALKHIQNTHALEPINARIDAATDLADCIDMDRLARGEWLPPAEIPPINLADWPWDGSCEGEIKNTPRLFLDPISEFADKYPEKFAGYDRRHEHEAYLQSIRDFLRENQGNRS